MRVRARAVPLGRGLGLAGVGFPWCGPRPGARLWGVRGGGWGGVCLRGVVGVGGVVVWVGGLEGAVSLVA